MDLSKKVLVICFTSLPYDIVGGFCAQKIVMRILEKSDKCFKGNKTQLMIYILGLVDMDIIKSNNTLHIVIHYLYN